MPEYLIWCPYHGQSREDAARIHAQSASFAAAQWAKDRDCFTGKFELLGGEEVEVTVYDCHNATEEKYIVGGNTVPRYYARLVKE